MKSKGITDKKKPIAYISLSMIMYFSHHESFIAINDYLYSLMKDASSRVSIDAANTNALMCMNI